MQRGNHNLSFAFSEDKKQTDWLRVLATSLILKTEASLLQREQIRIMNVLSLLLWISGQTERATAPRMLSLFRH